MPLATPLRTAARNLITSFGNSAALYPWASAIKTTTEEGDEMVSLWISSETTLVLFSGTCDVGGTTTQMNDVGVDFTGSIGRYVTLDTPASEWAVITGAGNGYIQFGALSSGGSCATARTYKVLAATAVNGQAIKVVDGGNQGIDLVQGNMGKVSIGEDQKIVRDDVTVAVNDRLSYASKNYRITAVKEERVESSVIISIITVNQTTDTTNW